MTIPTDATHEAFIHDLDVVRVDVRMSALEPGLRTLVEKLSQELHVARAELAAGRAVRDEYLEELNEIRHLLGAGPGVTALEAVKLAQKEAARLARRARAHLAAGRAVRDEYLEELNEIRHLLGAGPGVTALEAVKARREAQAETRGVAEAAVELLNEVRAALGVGEGDLTTEAVKRVVRERDEEKARRLEAESELEMARVEAEAKPNQAAWEAACRLRKERDEAKALAQTEVTRASRLAIEVNTLRRLLDDMTKERDKAFACWRAAQTTWSRALSELEKVAGAK